jgi:hypothetical protein
MNGNKLFLNSSAPKSSGIPPSLRYGATLPALWTRRSSKSEGGFRRQPGIPLPEPELITQVRPTPRFSLKFVINAG